VVGQGAALTPPETPVRRLARPLPYHQQP